MRVFGTLYALSLSAFLLAACDEDMALPGGGDDTPEIDPCRGFALPDNQHFAAAGTCARLVADKQGPLRQITFAPNGDLFGVTTKGSIVRYRDADKNGSFEPGAPETIEWAHTGGNGNSLHIDSAGGFIYAGTPDGVKRFAYNESADSGGEGEEVITNQPMTGTHTFHTAHVYDGWLYVQSGSEDNFVAPMLPDYDTQRSVIKRFDLSSFDLGQPFDWATSGEVFAVGLRNTVGFTRDGRGRIFGVVNGMDNLMYGGKDIHDNNPGEQVLQIEMGGKYGYPYCFTAQEVLDANNELVPPGTQLMATVADATFTNPHDDSWCAGNSMPPDSFLQAHSAPLDIVFNDGPIPTNAPNALPERFRGGAFISLHGSWNRDISTGFKVIYLPFDENGVAAKPTASGTTVSFPYEVVFGGGTSTTHEDGEWSWSEGARGETVVRPVGVAISPIDGALYISSDNGMGPMNEANGALYRIGTKTTGTGVIP